MRVTSKTVIYRFSLQSHNKIMMAKYHIKLKDLFWSYFPAYVIYFTEGIIIAVFTIFLRERNHRFNTKVWRYTDWLIEGWNAIGIKLGGSGMVILLQELSLASYDWNQFLCRVEHFQGLGDSLSNSIKWFYWSQFLCRVECNMTKNTHIMTENDRLWQTPVII